MGVNAVSLISSVKPLYLASEQYVKLFDAFGVHADQKYAKATDALKVLEDCIEYYRKCQSEISRELFNLPPEKKPDGSFGSPSTETVTSLQMVRQSLQGALVIFPNLKIITKALTKQVNEHLYAKAMDLGVNQALGCLDFAINFPSIVDEVMKRITKLPFLFYTHPSSYYEIPEDFVKFEDMSAIPKSPHAPLPASDIGKLRDYQKK